MKQKMYVKPVGYRPPSSSEELVERHSSGERFFEGASLSDSALMYSTFDRLNLRHSNLSNATLKQSAFSHADLGDCCFSGADLAHASFYQCSFAESDLRSANFYMTVVVDVSFFKAQIEGAQFLQCLHGRRSHDGSEIPPPITSRKGASCFVSYSTDDPPVGDLAEALQHAGLPNWFMPRSTWFDASIAPNLERAIKMSDYLVFVLSHGALRSTWVEAEIKFGLRSRGTDGKPEILVMRLDDSELPNRYPFDRLLDCEIIDAQGGRWNRGKNKLIRLLRR